jgi:geranylgeranyl transferase type-2 subunit beta
MVEGAPVRIKKPWEILRRITPSFSMSLMTLNVPLHVKYIQNLGNSDDELIYHLTAHLRLNAVYWGLAALCVMGHKEALDRSEMIEFVMSCWDDEAGTL